MNDCKLREETLSVSFSRVKSAMSRCSSAKLTQLHDIYLYGIERCVRRGTDLYFRRVRSHRRRDSAYTPNRGKPINPRTDAPKDTIARTAFRRSRSRNGRRLQQRSPAPRLIPGERRGVCHQNSGDRSGQWEVVEGVDRGGHGGQCARTTRTAK